MRKKIGLNYGTTVLRRKSQECRKIGRTTIATCVLLKIYRKGERKRVREEAREDKRVAKREREKKELE